MKTMMKTTKKTMVSAMMGTTTEIISFDKRKRVIMIALNKAGFQNLH